MVHIEPTSLTGIEAGPGAKLLVRGTVVNPTMASYTWTWTVTSNTTQIAPVTKMDDVSSTFEFAIPKPDNFMITARVNDSKCAPSTVLASSVVAKPGFVFRTTAARYPTQEQRIDLAALPTPTLSLQPGTAYLIRPLRQSNVLLAYLRLKGPGSTLSLEGDTTHGPVMANLSATSLYDLLIVPIDQTVAPLLLRNYAPGALEGVQVDQGLRVAGQALDDGGSPIANARMILKQGELPSTVGVSGTGGQLELWARAGTASAIVVPPASSGLPQATVDLADGAGVVIPTDTSSFLLTMKWNAVTRAGLTIGVLGLDGTSPLSGARVHVSLHATASPVGVLTVSRPGTMDTSLSATGTLDVESISDTAGQARFASLPVGTYDVTITPPAGQGSAAITALSVKVPATGLSRNVTLVQKVGLTGKLGPLPAGQGASVTALDKSSGATGTTVTAVAGSDGVFTLSVDPNRNYQLIIQPRLGQGLGRAVIASVAVAAGGTSLGSMALPPALNVNGSVTVSGSGNPVAAAFVQVFCVATSATCADPSISLGEATTLGDGSFAVALPDPTAPPPL